MKLKKKEIKWVRDAEKSGELPRVIEGAQVYRVADKTYKVKPFKYETERVEIIWRDTPFFQDKDGKIQKKY